MDVITAARELGKAIQLDERYTRLDEASSASEKDTELQGLIADFNKKRAELNREISKKDKDQDRLRELDRDIKELYGDIMANPNMIEFNEAKIDMDALMSSVNYILTQSANGEDPDFVDENPPSSCGSGGCSGCSGCG